MATHLSEELARSTERVTVQTRHGPISGARAANGAIAFLEIPYALPPRRFEDPERLPASFRYEDRAYISESSYAVQPENDGQAAGVPKELKLGLGRPSENPLFLNIVIPSSFGASSKFSVKVYIHGGFLQFGSPHGWGSQGHHVAEERHEVRVNIGYRLSAFGFLACDEPKVEGNFGFKDQWLALEWIKENITVFGGDSEDIQVTGLSAGAHSVHQILHHASRLRPGQTAPFQSAVLYSNAIVNAPKTPKELRAQFEALCTCLSLDPASAEALNALRDPAKTPWKEIISTIEEKLSQHGTFRGCLDGSWLLTDPDPMTWQRSGGFAEGLRRAGVKSIVVGDLTEEWYLYSIAHPVKSKDDIKLNLLRYYPEDIARGLLQCYPQLDESASEEDLVKQFGEILSDAQVHLPVRLLARDLTETDFPVLRYEIRWTPEQARALAKGYVTHGTDSALWNYNVPFLKPVQLAVARDWLRTVDKEVRSIEKAGKPLKGVREILILNEDMSIAWGEDRKFDEIMRLVGALPGEGN